MPVFEDALTKAIKKGQDTGVLTSRHSARSLARVIYNQQMARVTARLDANKKMFDDIVNICLSA